MSTAATKEDRYENYLACFEAIGLPRTEIARILNLGADVTKSAAAKLSDKLNCAPNRAITKADALNGELLKLTHLLLATRGLSLESLEFDDTGKITDRYIRNTLKQFK